VLTAIAPPGEEHDGLPGEHRRVITPGFQVSWNLHAPRWCVGRWTGSTRAPCPARARLPDNGTDAQCPACAAGDRGRQIARDAVLGDDDRDYTLYLAWFGAGLLKVGLTAADRGLDRLLEQGAIACTLLATGPYTPIRRAERLISGASLARERIGARAKAEAWWDLPPAAERAACLVTARNLITAQLPWPDRVRMLPCTVVDQAAEFGLDQGPPSSYAEVTGLAGGAVLTGQIHLVIGRRLLLGTSCGPLLIDMRRVAGWTIATATGSAPAGMETTTRARPRDHHDQAALF
jgi:hypothetical protein